MHWLGVDLQVDVERASPAPGEPATECLLATPRYDFAWQRTYVYEASPAALPVLRPGDRVTLRCTYDNTAANAYLRRSLQERHLSSPVAVGLGESTFEEMCNAVLVYLRPVP